MTIQEQKRKVHLLRHGRITACGKEIVGGIDYTPKVFPWEGYGDVTCELCKEFVDKLNLTYQEVKK